MVSADPTAEVDSAHAAIVQAEILLRVGRAGLGRDRPADIWDVQAVHPLAALLFAASPLGNGLGIGWVQAALDNVDPEDVQSPGWAQAALMCSLRAERLGRSMVATLTAHPADRDAIVAAVRAAFQGRHRVGERRCG
ncbi:type IV secretion system protein VirD4 [Mycolicibacterium sp.]|uniref:type IV secretion system protein VirD4 n=1 Tax=Mycolicibacterium sp. TaxID=2320850 RepID=UPI0037C51559